MLLKKILENSLHILAGFVSGIIALFAPAIPIVITVFCFILVDAYYGYKVSRRYGQKEIESHKVWKTVHKLTESLSVMILALLVDKYILLTYLDLSSVKVVSGVICLAEGLSLLEAFRALHPHSLLSKLLAKVIKSKAEKYLQVDISDIINIKDITNDTNKNNTK